MTTYLSRLRTACASDARDVLVDRNVLLALLDTHTLVARSMFEVPPLTSLQDAADEVYLTCARVQKEQRSVT